MAEQLVEDMSAKWNPGDYRDVFKEEVMKLVEQKVKAGQTESVVQPEPQEAGSGSGAEIIDLTELLQRSLKGGKTAGKPAARRPGGSRSPAVKPRRKAA